MSEETERYWRVVEQGHWFGGFGADERCQVSLGACFCGTAFEAPTRRHVFTAYWQHLRDIAAVAAAQGAAEALPHEVVELLRRFRTLLSRPPDRRQLVDENAVRESLLVILGDAEEGTNV